MPEDKLKFLGGIFTSTCVSHLMWIQQSQFRLSGSTASALTQLRNQLLSKYSVIEKLEFFKLPLLWVEKLC